MPQGSLRRPDVLAELVGGGYAALGRLWTSGDETSRPVLLAGRSALLVRGEEGARLFYDTARMSRRRAVPALVANPLFGRGALHGLDDTEHDVRKAMMLRCVEPDRVTALADNVRRRWTARTEYWLATGRGRVFDDAVTVLGDAVLDWAGVPDPAPSAAQDLAAMVDGFGSASPARGTSRRLARRRCERWARAAVRDARTSVRPTESQRAVDIVAAAKDQSGQLLDERTAAVELLNLVRPTVAVAWFVAFAALAIAEHPEMRPRLTSDGGDPAYRTAFAHELRRAYPFVPLLAARARDELRWHGHRLPAGGPLLHIRGSTKPARVTGPTS